MTAKKIGVLTFHRCINYGSYWQARCLVEGLQARGHEAVLLDHHSDRVARAELRCAFQPTLPHRTGRADLPRYAAKTRAFLQAFDRLPLSRRFTLENPAEMAAQDLVVVGSDEVWNHRHPWYGGEPLFYGVGLNAPRIAAYAASFGNHNAEDRLDDWWAERLRGFDAISVRDTNSQALVRDATGETPVMVLDPCLQFPPAAAEPFDAGAPYLLVYGHNFPDWFVAAVTAQARARGLRLLSLGYRNDWADEQRIELGPIAFAQVYAGATAVATNFFHGCVFALLNAKPFVCAGSHYRSNKVSGLTQSLNAAVHLVHEETPASDYARLLAEPLAPAIGEAIVRLRTQSTRYLDHVLA